MQYLVVGSGSIGRRHLANLRALQPDAHITLLQRADSATRADQFDVQPDRIVHSLADALQQPITAAIVASPATKHLETAIPLIRHGAHVLLEKPIAADASGLAELFAVCDANERILMVAYNLRFHPALRAMKRALDNNQIGRILSLRAEVGQYLPDWRPGSDYRTGCSAQKKLGGGVLLELSHELDYVQWLLGPAQSVSAIVDRVSDLEIDVSDIAVLNIRFESGAIGSVHLDFIQRTPFRQCRVIGTDGTLQWDAIAGDVSIVRAGAEWQQLPAESAADRNQMYLDELSHFLDCIQNGTQPIVTGSDGARALRLALAAEESSRSGETVAL